MNPTENAGEEIRRLRRTMRDMVALSTLPAVWSGLDPEGIARSLADVLFATLSLDLIYIRLPGLASDARIEVVRGTNYSGPGDDAAVAAALAPLLQDDLTESSRHDRQSVRDRDIAHGRDSVWYRQRPRHSCRCIAQRQFSATARPTFVGRRCQPDRHRGSTAAGRAADACTAGVAAGHAGQHWRRGDRH